MYLLQADWTVKSGCYPPKIVKMIPKYLFGNKCCQHKGKSFKKKIHFMHIIKIAIVTIAYINLK